ncbi:MAG: penicillin-binding protein 1A [Bacteroidia bacterium]
MYPNSPYNSGNTEPQTVAYSPTNNEVSPPPKGEKPQSYYTGRKYFFLSVGLFFAAILGFCIYAIMDIPPLTEIENPKSDLSTQIFSSDGVQLGTLYSDENRIGVKLNEISDYAIKALVATEDHRFKEHSGVDPESFPALIASALEGNPRGGSTITMQLARNLYDKVGRKRNAIRKLKEYIVSAYLERAFTKDEITAAYFNTVNIYGNDYGIETASLRLFGKTAKQLNLNEAALLVGMLKGPGYYSPIKYPARALARRNTVLDQMVKRGVVKQRVADSARKHPIVLNKGKDFDHNVGAAPYFREYIRQYLKDWCKTKGLDPYADGLKVYTTLDSRMQKYGEEAVRDHISSLQVQFTREMTGREPYLKDPNMLKRLMEQSDRYVSAKKAKRSDAEIKKEFNTPTRMNLFTWKRGEVKDTLLTPMDSMKYYAKMLSTGFVAVEPNTGHIKAWVGGISYKHLKFDHVGLAKRQVGSTFKPFVYAAAIDNGKRPCDVELNQPVVFESGGKRWSPKNSDGSVGGYVTLKMGLAKSLNLITARLMKEFGPKVIAQYAYNMGVESKLAEVPALCLGVSDVSLLEMVGAYGTFANKGIYVKPLCIARIEDRNGNVIEDFIPVSRKALSEEKAYTMIDMMKDVVDQQYGTANRLRHRYGFKSEIAGKTGTTQENADGWFIGITPTLVAGAWTGCDERKMHSRSTAFGQGANVALPIWALFFKKVYADKSIGMPQEPFEKPEGWTNDCNQFQSTTAPTKYVNFHHTQSVDDENPPSVTPSPSPSNNGGTTPTPAPVTPERPAPKPVMPQKPVAPPKKGGEFDNLND